MKKFIFLVLIVLLVLLGVAQTRTGSESKKETIGKSVQDDMICRAAK